MRKFCVYYVWYIIISIIEVRWQVYIQKKKSIGMKIQENFIMSQPENPWSLDRGMNGVMFKLIVFYRNAIKLVKYMI